MAETALAVTSEVDHQPLDSLTAAADHITATCLADMPVGLVGLELEAHCFDMADPGRRPGWDELCAVIDSAPDLPGGSRVTVEPGGAVELSTPPASGVVAAIEALTADRAVLRTLFAKAGLGLVLLGTDPLRRPRRINPGARYHAMEQHFAAAQTGAAGAAMMTSTASVQVNVDAGPADGLGRPGAAHSCARPDDDCDLGQLAAAGRKRSPDGAAPASGCGGSSTPPAAVRCSAPAATTRPATGRGTRCGRR